MFGALIIVFREAIEGGSGPVKRVRFSPGLNDIVVVNEPKPGELPVDRHLRILVFRINHNNDSLRRHARGLKLVCGQALLS
jgi:hypothetical protein